MDSDRYGDWSLGWKEIPNQPWFIYNSRQISKNKLVYDVWLDGSKFTISFTENMLNHHIKHEDLDIQFEIMFGSDEINSYINKWKLERFLTQNE